jgi:phosphate transport system protein
VPASATQGALDRVERSALEAALRDAERGTLAELEMVRGTFRRAVEAAVDCDAGAARDVTAKADEFDRRYAEVHDRLLSLIALQAPVASDLRFAIALLHINDRLQRMGAQCVNLATLCSALPEGARPSSGQLACLSAMAELVDEQMAEAARVLAERDADGAERLRDHDQAINDHNLRCFALAVHDGEDELRREAAFLVAMMARALERIGDNAVDIARQVAFTVTGRLRPS